jgi:hypothetical protein
MNRQICASIGHGAAVTSANPVRCVHSLLNQLPNLINAGKRSRTNIQKGNLAVRAYATKLLTISNKVLRNAG